MIRGALKADAPQIFAIEASCMECPWSLSDIEQAVENPGYIFLVLVCDGAVAGYGSLRVAEDEAEINNVAVAAQFRRRGIAETLLQALMEQAYAIGVKIFFLEVAPENIAAAALYQKSGFTKIATRKNYYGKGKDADVLKYISE